MTYHYIYKITNNITGHYYIGAHSTRNIMDGYLGSGILICKAIEYYGKKNFTMIMIKNYKSRRAMFIAERKIVNRAIVLDPNSYNLITGGRRKSKNSYKVKAKTKNCKEILSAKYNRTI